MASGKDEAQDVIIDDLVQCLIHCFGQPLLPVLKLPRNLSALLLQHPPTRRKSMARRFAAVMSQAAGLSGMPSSGHCSIAATSAS